jgi:hypothetical protein
MANEPTLWDEEEQSLARRLLFRDAADLAPRETFRWWEKRRLLYNAVVGATGLVTLTAASFLEFLVPGPSDGPQALMFALFYGTMANLAYSFGSVAELALKPFFGRKAPVVGAALFRYGLAFSVGLTALPLPFISIGILARLLGLAN